MDDQRGRRAPTDVRVGLARSGVTILHEMPGSGVPIERQRTYRIRLHMWLNRGDPIRWLSPWGLIDRAILEDDGRTLLTDVRFDRRSLVNGIFYGMHGMRIGGTRTFRISPHLAYGERGVPGVIPAHAVLVVEVTVLEERVV